MARGKNETGVARGRLRSASREVGTSIVRPSPEITEMGVGSALRGLVMLATRGRRPKFAPKKASLEEKIKYREARAKDLKNIRDQKKARSQAGKTATKPQFPTSNVKVVRKPVKKTAAKKTPKYRAKKSRVKPTPGNKEFYETKRTPEQIAAMRDATRPPVKKAAPKVAPKRRKKTPAEMERDIERAAARKEMIAKKKAQAARIRSSREWAAKRS